MKYFDNAATTWPKPEPVYRACDQYLRGSANPGRGGYRQALDSARLIFEARQSVAAFAGIKHAERLVFTSGCTHSLNAALKGFGFKEADVVVTTSAEHNSVMRPLNQLVESVGIKIEKLPYCENGIFNIDDLCRALAESKPRLCVVNEASNVTGAIVDLASVAEACRKYQVPLMVDAAQSAGFRAAAVEELGIALWCAAGHKGLMGPAGVGLLYVAPDITLEPLIAGGTGSKSEDLKMPSPYPDHLEAGTLPGPAIAGLAAAVGFLESEGMEKIASHKKALTQKFLAFARKQEFLEVFGPDNDFPRVGIVSFRVKGLGCDRVADILDQDYQISVRSGLHCAASVHRALGTLESGLVRVSFGYFNSETDIEGLCDSLLAISVQSARS